MPLDLSAVGRTAGPRDVTWTSRDALLYALGVGAGQDDPLQELQFTTENSRDVTQQVLPTYGVVLVQGGGGRIPFGDVNWAMLVHAEQAMTLHKPLPVEGRASVVSKLVGIYDKGSGALVVTESSAADVATGEPLLSAVTSAFVRGEGGFGGDRGPSSTWQRPDRAPDLQASAQTRPDQALLYRLSGDRNPLHSDPAFAKQAGFSRPILHGLCSYGVTGRLLLHGLCGSDPARFRSMRARFSKPVMPGARLTVSIWREPPQEAAPAQPEEPVQVARFQTTDDAGAVVIDQGEVSFTLRISDDR